MTKNDFYFELSKKLSALPIQEVEQRWEFYSEIIDDYIEDGLSEEEAVLKLGSVDEIATQILSETPLSMIVKEKIKHKRKMNAWEIVLLVLGFPVWFPILISVLVVLFSVYMVLWSVIFTFWAVFASFVATAIAGLLAGIVFIPLGLFLQGFLFIACSFVLAGLSIFCFFGCKYATKGLLLLTKKILLFIKHCFVKKEEV